LAWSHISGGSHVILGIITAIFPLAGFFLILSLEAFHVWIIILRTTTYKWILNRRREREEAQFKKEQRAREKENAKSKKSVGVEMTDGANTDSERLKQRLEKEKQERAKKEARKKKSRRSS